MSALAHLLAAIGPVSAPLGEPTQGDLLAARHMQALSLGFHIVLVCFGLAFPALVLFAHGLWLRTGKPVYKALAQRWAKAMLILFAIGVVTGTILSFELGILWPGFMAAFAEVFGVGFTLEGVSFFLEAIFIALYVYGWDRFPRRAHFLLGVPIVIAGITGSLLVIAVNGWMNKPAGFDVVDGAAVNPRPFEALFANDAVWHQLAHMYLAAYVVVGFLIAATYAAGWLRGKRTAYHRAGLAIGLAVAALVTPVQLVVGDWAGRKVAHNQPSKLAAMEGLATTERGAPLHIGGIYKDGEVRYGIEIPKALSLVAFHDPNATVRGLDAYPEEDRPPVNVVRLSFQAMVGIGVLLTALGAVFLVSWARRGRLPLARWYLRTLVVAGPLSVVALIAGWIVTEVGRQPWIVYEVMRTAQAVTDIEGLGVAYALLAAFYAALAGTAAFLLRRLAHSPLPPAATGGAAGPADDAGRPSGPAGARTGVAGGLEPKWTGGA